jgi:hypothetical protein
MMSSHGRGLSSLIHLSSGASSANKSRLSSGGAVENIAIGLVSKKHTGNEKRCSMETEIAEILEGLSPDDLQDILCLSRLQVAVQPKRDIFISLEDWANTPRSVKKAIGHVLAIVKAAVPVLINSRS